MLANFFYFFGLICFLFNFILLTKFKDYLFIKEFSAKFEKVTGKRPEKKDFTKSNYELYSFMILTIATTVVWFFIGLLSKNWLIFLIYLLFNPLLEFISKKSQKIKIIYNSLELIRLLVNILIILSLVINQFHFHQNLTHLILR